MTMEPLPEALHEANRRGLLLVQELYASVQGESRAAGLPGVIVRLTGCPLRCAWCDTQHAYEGGTLREVAALVDEVRAFGLPSVLVTGGEPLAQRACLPLLAALAETAPIVLLESSGALPIEGVDPRVRRIVDMKAPSSGATAHMRLENLALLGANDELKFVVADRADYEWARSFIAEHDLSSRTHLLMGLVAGRLPPATLVAWILEDRLPVRFQLQLHKQIWGPEARGR